MNREILRLAVPNIISNVSIPLLSTVDTALMGRLSPLHIGAVGLASMIFNFIYWNFGFLRMGTTGMTAQAFGKGDDKEIASTLGRAVLISLILAFLIILFQVPLISLGIKLMNVPQAQIVLVEEYFYIRIWAAPASLLLYTLLGWFFGLQNAFYPLVITILINTINIVLSYLFIMVYEWDVQGVAWSTVIAQYSGLILSIALILYRYKKQILQLHPTSLFAIAAFRRFLNVNTNLFIRTLCLTFSFGYFYSQSAKFGSNLLAVNVILLQFINWLSYAIDGFAYAAESVVGKYIGSQEFPQAKKAIKKSFFWGILLSVIFAIGYGLGGEEILKLFTRDNGVILAGKSYLHWMWIVPLIAFASYIWDGVFIGLTASVAMRNSMIISLVIYIGFYSFITPSMNNLWSALVVFLIARGLIQTMYFSWKGLYLK